MPIMPLPGAMLGSGKMLRTCNATELSEVVGIMLLGKGSLRIFQQLKFRPIGVDIACYLKVAFSAFLEAGPSRKGQQMAH